jgi:hypothetical protein
VAIRKRNKKFGNVEGRKRWRNATDLMQTGWKWYKNNDWRDKPKAWQCSNTARKGRDKGMNGIKERIKIFFPIIFNWSHASGNKAGRKFQGPS